ncbi:MAG TPA: hypothetical protein VD887_13235 [Allosphingosinicella sp.]|nr:hypothetical protein [Allosphingosinicella sp.]
MARSRRRRVLLAFVAAMALAAVYVVAAGSVSKGLSREDLQAIALLRAEPYCRERSGFASELRCIRHVQAAVLAIGRSGSCARKGSRIEPMDFIRRGYGCCFDRARFIEKALGHYGYTTRHAALYSRRYGLPGLLTRWIDSHAGTEVLTVRGWLAVDSVQPFILMTRDGRPLRFADYHDPAPGQPVERAGPGHDFRFDRPYYVIYGLYSRHGGFHGPNLPAPEIHYPDFLRYTLLRQD